MIGDGTITTYQQGETPRITATITDSDGNAADPSTILISIEKPDDSIAVDGTAMTKSEVGIYYHDYTIPADGVIGPWRYNVVATGTAGRVAIKRSWFNVELAI